jgi:hypothetical protein
MGTQLLETHIKPGNIFERSPNIFRKNWLDAGAEFPWLERQNGAPSMGRGVSWKWINPQPGLQFSYSNRNNKEMIQWTQKYITP